MDRYGLIAGNGKFPFLVLEAARSRGIDMVVAAIKEETFPEIEEHSSQVYWMSIGQLGKLIETFKLAGVKTAVMAGQVKHVQIFASATPDSRMLEMLSNLKQKNTDSLIGAVADILAEEGITLIDSTSFLRPLLAPRGVLTERALTPAEEDDTNYGRYVAKEVARLDLGQTIVVRDKAVVAIEAMEGTDATIMRAASLSNGRELTVVKVSKPNQDMRFDVPVIGVGTIETMIKAKASALAIDAGKTLLIDRNELLALANKHKISIVSFA